MNGNVVSLTPDLEAELPKPLANIVLEFFKDKENEERFQSWKHEQ